MPRYRSYFAPGWFEERDEFTLFFKSSYSAIHPIPHNVVVQLILFFKSSWCKIANVARNLINSAPQTSATTFASSGLFILLYKYVYCTVPFQKKNLRKNKLSSKLMRTFFLKRPLINYISINIWSFPKKYFRKWSLQINTWLILYYSMYCTHTILYLQYKCLIRQNILLLKLPCAIFVRIMFILTYFECSFDKIKYLFVFPVFF